MSLLGSWLAAPAAAEKPANEPFFPNAGNPGYDASRYDVNLRYRPGSGRIEAMTAMTAEATERMTRLPLDFLGPEVSRVEVAGRPTATRLITGATDGGR